MQAEIVLGVVSGVMTSGILLLAKSLWSDHAEPFVKKVQYSGLDISGQWTALFVSEDSATRFALDITQSAHAITGTCSLEFYSASNEYRMPQTITGELWEGYLSLRFKAVDRKITSYSVGLLKVSGGGVGLEGMHLFRDVNDEVVNNISISYARGTGNARHVITFNEAAAKFQAQNLAMDIQGPAPTSLSDAAPNQGAGEPPTTSSDAA